ncbi:hypothetical protein [Sphingopyxis sp. 550A]
MTDLDKAWREFTDAVAEALRIPAMLDWLAAQIDKLPSHKAAKAREAARIEQARREQGWREALFRSDCETLNQKIAIALDAGRPRIIPGHIIDQRIEP